MVLLCAAYVFGCAFRSVLPRADVQRICLFDTWLSSVFVGRSVATIAEICFVVQWAIVLRYLASLTQIGHGAATSRTPIVPLILLAECCSWYAVITTSYLGNTVENSIWAVTFLLIAVALLRLMTEFRGAVQLRDRRSRRRHRRLSRLPRHHRRADVFRPLAGRPARAARSCSACSRACMT